MLTCNREKDTCVIGFPCNIKMLFHEIKSYPLQFVLQRSTFSTKPWQSLSELRMMRHNLAKSCPHSLSVLRKCLLSKYRNCVLLPMFHDTVRVTLISLNGTAHIGLKINGICRKIYKEKYLGMYIEREIQEACYFRPKRYPRWIGICPQSTGFMNKNPSFWLIFPWTKRALFRRRYFQMHFREWKVLCFD